MKLSSFHKKGLYLKFQGKLSCNLRYIYYFQNKPIAFTEIKVFDSKHVLTGQFAWDYENPKLSIGTYATLYEIDWSIKNK